MHGLSLGAKPQIQHLWIPEAVPLGLTDARWVVGQELCTHREQSVALDIGDAPCAAEELVTQETEKNVKPSLQ